MRSKPRKSVQPLNVAKRRADKQRSRDEDARDLAEGRKSHADLNQKNGVFGRLKAHINFERSTLA